MFEYLAPPALRLILLCAPLTAAAALAGCEGDMVRDAGGGQDDSSSPGQPADDGGFETGAGDAEADGASDAACAVGDGAADGACDGGPDGAGGG